MGRITNWILMSLDIQLILDSLILIVSVILFVLISVFLIRFIRKRNHILDKKLNKDEN